MTNRQVNSWVLIVSFMMVISLFFPLFLQNSANAETTDPVFDDRPKNWEFVGSSNQMKWKQPGNRTITLVVSNYYKNENLSWCNYRYDIFGEFLMDVYVVEPQKEGENHRQWLRMRDRSDVPWGEFVEYSHRSPFQGKGREGYIESLTLEVFLAADDIKSGRRFIFKRPGRFTHLIKSEQ